MFEVFDLLFDFVFGNGFEFHPLSNFSPAQLPVYNWDSLSIDSKSYPLTISVGFQLIPTYPTDPSIFTSAEALRLSQVAYQAAISDY